MPRVQDANSRYVWTPIFTGTPNQSMLPRVVLGTDNGLPQPARGNFASLMPPSGTGDQNRSIQFPCFRRRGNMKFCLNGVPIRDFVSLDPGFNTKVEDADAVVIDMSKESFILLISVSSGQIFDSCVMLNPFMLKRIKYPEYPVLSVGVTISAEPAESQTRRYTLTRGQLLIQICSIVCEFMNVSLACSLFMIPTNERWHEQMAAGVKGPESPYRIGRGGVGLGQVIFSRIYQTWEDTWVLKLYPIVSIIETPSTQKDF
ncbi:hypothetical protein DENSPDRAFT_845857 [Dentipellis sp. KUC8613]|nr:hypothetical protein DENSPDRAFT_845857 [Dentipellis sp. KUC8613]